MKLINYGLIVNSVSNVLELVRNNFPCMGVITFIDDDGKSA